ncbi:MAG TPA: caspase family protein [Thioploca sp.]|nr:MAG: hypothetical protein B6247_24525 [Beggiatoa sp. 4572_84]RKZ62911.1 MAG: hypothetical protein DRR08_04830 [Gammaproteobacteria bacterium]HDN27075.1 caspase family protein [Thioploca sp.]
MKNEKCKDNNRDRNPIFLKKRISLPLIYILLGLSFQPLYARCSLPRVASGTPVALVIANSQYQQGRLSRQPVNDGNAMKTVLKKLGFRVIFKTELNEKAMNKATVDFSRCLQISKGVGLFYFSGYGMQLYGTNYLLPINTSIMDQYDVEYDTFSVNKMLERLKKLKNKLNIIILDASRESPYPNFGLRRGLASMSPPNGFFISYPTEPDKIVLQTSRYKNSLYVRKIVQVLKKAKQNHTRIEDVFMQVTNAVEQESYKQQIPWYNGSSKKKFCFGGCRNKTTYRPTSKPRPTYRQNTTAKLIVSSNINGAYVYINDKFAGTIRAGRITKKWPLGRITVRVEKNNCVPFKQSFYLQRNKRVKAQLKCAVTSRPLCSCCGWHGCSPCPCQ